MKQNCKFLGASLDVLIKESATDEQIKHLLVLVRKNIKLSESTKVEIDAKLNHNNDRKI